MPKKTFEAAENVGAKLITQVKNNQESLLTQIKHGCIIQKPIDVFEEIDKGHGRLEQRKYEVFSATPMLDKWLEDWPYIRKIIKVTRIREVLGKNSKKTIETHYYVSNSNLTAPIYGNKIRSHWYIENKLHHIKDRTFLEDKSTKRVNPNVFSCLIDFALNIIRKNKVENIRQFVYAVSLSFENLLKELYDNEI